MSEEVDSEEDEFEEKWDEEEEEEGEWESEEDDYGGSSSSMEIEEEEDDDEWEDDNRSSGSSMENADEEEGEYTASDLKRDVELAAEPSSRRTKHAGSSLLSRDKGPAKRGLSVILTSKFHCSYIHVAFVLLKPGNNKKSNFQVEE